MSSEKPGYLIIDVDGVMTTGQFLYSDAGKTYKVFGPHDNDGLKMVKDRIKVSFVTADKRGYSISKRRIVDDMGFELYLVGETERITFLTDNYGLENIAYIGDGYHDAPILKLCRYGIAPANARIEARAAADFVTHSRSGEGAVLDACLHLLEVFWMGELRQ